jgi:hypothetical protein
MPWVPDGRAGRAGGKSPKGPTIPGISAAKTTRSRAG